MRTPRVGFLGVGWIGRHRMEAMLSTGAIEAAAICDPTGVARAAAQELAPTARVVATIDEMLDAKLDGVVIATPSAVHANQAIRCLDAGLAVFCQKPLGRDAHEVAEVVAAGRRSRRLLMGDFSYRYTRGMRAIRGLVRNGSLGKIFAVDLVFHNAYGPDKPWFYNRAEAGGGCAIDLGIHLIDLALWLTDFARPASNISATILREGKRLDPNEGGVEDYAAAAFMIGGEVAVRLACSWRLHAGQDADIQVSVYGTDGGACMRNVNGSFYDFHTERFHKTTRNVIDARGDDWSGRAAKTWARALAAGIGSSRNAEHYVQAALVLDGLVAAARA